MYISKFITTRKNNEKFGMYISSLIITRKDKET